MIVKLSQSALDILTLKLLMVLFNYEKNRGCGEDCKIFPFGFSYTQCHMTSVSQIEQLLQ